MLMHFYINIEYQPKLRGLLGGFDTYYRSDEFFEELDQYNPNLSADREIFICKFILPYNDKWTYRHKFVLLQALKWALENNDYDFQQYFMNDDEDCSYFPPGWENLNSAREFYEDILRLFKIHWKDELDKAAQENPATG